MSLFHANAGQAEIIRTVQKDVSISQQLSNNFSDLLRITGNRNWIRYNHLCRIFSEFSYHGFSSLNNLQTLGEEYTGIIQVDQNYITIPHKLIQFTSIILEFGGETLLNKLITNFKYNLEENDELLPEAKRSMITFLEYIIKSVPYIKAIHRSLFYVNGGKYQISKRLTGINYVLVRHWLKENQSIYGYKVLGIFTLLQIVLSIIVNLREKYIEIKNSKILINKNQITRTPRKKSSSIEIEGDYNVKKCVLCLEALENTSVTKCGHLFCWNCILDWLGQKSECPVCREVLNKSSTVFLRNYC